MFLQQSTTVYLAQLAGLSMEEVGEVSLVSNPAQVLPKRQPRTSQLLQLCFLFAQPEQGVYCSRSNNLRSLLSVRGTGYKKASNSCLGPWMMQAVVGETAETVAAVSLSCERGFSCKISICLISSACFYVHHQRCKEIPAVFPGALVSQLGMFGEEGLRLGWCSACQRYSACWWTTARCRQWCSPTDQVNWFSCISLASLLGCQCWGFCQPHWAKLLCASRDPILHWILLKENFQAGEKKNCKEQQQFLVWISWNNPGNLVYNFRCVWESVWLIMEKELFDLFLTKSNYLNWPLYLWKFFFLRSNRSCLIRHTLHFWLKVYLQQCKGHVLYFSSEKFHLRSRNGLEGFAMLGGKSLHQILNLP